MQKLANNPQPPSKTPNLFKQASAQLKLQNETPTEKYIVMKKLSSQVDIYHFLSFNLQTKIKNFSNKGADKGFLIAFE